MSTRCNVIIKNMTDKLIYYRHSDGYPDGALPTLKKLMNWVKSGRIRNNVDQAAGWLILIGAEEYNEYYVPGSNGETRQKTTLTEPTNEDKINGWKCGSYEPSMGIHGDIEYLYTLDLAHQTIIVHHVEYTDGENGFQDRKRHLKKISTITNFDLVPATLGAPAETNIIEPDKTVVKPSRFDDIM